mmetsp:Transcript_2655/g.5719  ORF Transcript_2655/g.5719 Transcript_2655/m.5719 type:complete len:176 (-) Transcript_2655:283-810(-)
MITCNQHRGGTTTPQQALFISSSIPKSHKTKTQTTETSQTTKAKPKFKQNSKPQTTISIHIMAVPRRDNDYSNTVSGTVDLLDLLDRRTWKPKDSANHPERRKVNLLDVMDMKDIEQIMKNKKAPVVKKNDKDKKKDDDGQADVDLLDLLDSRTFKPKDCAGHPERRKVDILDVM